MKFKCLYAKMNPLFARSGLDFVIDHIDTAPLPATLVEKASPFYCNFKVRNWCALMPNSSHMLNAYKGRPTDEERNMHVPQSFSFMCRQGVVSSCNCCVHLHSMVSLGCEVFSPVRYAWSRAWYPKGRAPAKETETRWKYEWCVRYGEGIHEWHNFVTASLASFSTGVWGEKQEILQRSEFHSLGGPAKCGTWESPADWRSCCSFWIWFSTFGACSILLPKASWQ